MSAVHSASGIKENTVSIANERRLSRDRSSRQEFSLGYPSHWHKDCPPRSTTPNSPKEKKKVPSAISCGISQDAQANPTSLKELKWRIDKNHEISSYSVWRIPNDKDEVDPRKKLGKIICFSVL